MRHVLKVEGGSEDVCAFHGVHWAQQNAVQLQGRVDLDHIRSEVMPHAAAGDTM